MYDEPPEELPNAAAPPLKEWVNVVTLAPLPPPPSPSWLRSLRVGEPAEACHEGGWWRVTLHARLPANARLHEPPKFEVEAIGYGIRRVVGAHELRPPSG